MRFLFEVHTNDDGFVISFMQETSFGSCECHVFFENELELNQFISKYLTVKEKVEI